LRKKQLSLLMVGPPTEDILLQADDKHNNHQTPPDDLPVIQSHYRK
jgi:hypothetical protein